jgi:hypothetical protein
MTDLSAEFKALANYRPTNKVRFVTAASLFDGTTPPSTSCGASCRAWARR